MGLGSATHVSLKEVRETASECRKVVRAGMDPSKERARQRPQAARNIHMLKDVAEDAFEARKAELKGDGKAGRWVSPLAWPRKGARDFCAEEDIPDTETPQAVINAAYELALAELVRPASTTPTVTPGRVVKRQKVDTIEREFSRLRKADRCHPALCGHCS